jgi:hypothetical protein
MITNFHKAGVSLPLDLRRWEIKELPDGLFMFIDKSGRQRFLIFREDESIKEEAIAKIKFTEREGLSTALWNKIKGTVRKDYLALKGNGNGILFIEAVSSGKSKWGINNLKKFLELAASVKTEMKYAREDIGSVNIKALKYPDKHGYGCQLDLWVEGTADTIMVSAIQMIFRGAGINQPENLVFSGDKLLMNSSIIEAGNTRKPFANIFSLGDSFHFCYESAGRSLNNYDSIEIIVTAFSLTNWERIVFEKSVKAEELEFSSLNLPVSKPVFFLNTAGPQSLHNDSVVKGRQVFYRAAVCGRYYR